MTKAYKNSSQDKCLNIGGDCVEKQLGVCIDTLNFVFILIIFLYSIGIYLFNYPHVHARVSACMYVCVCVCVCVYVHIHIHIQDVPGGMCQTSGECSLC